jgi:hypothetical protein
MSCNKIMEQVSQFKYLAYLITERRRGTESLTQRYSKLNNVTKENFSKQMLYKEDEMCGAAERDHLEDLVVDRTIILERILGK